MIKKAVILAGGYGTRLRRLTKTLNKHLIRVYDEPMIEKPLATIKRFGITDILVVSSEHQGEQVFKYLGSGKDHDVKFYFAVQEDAGGIAEALGLSETFAAGEPIMAILGDNIYDEKVFTKEINKKIKDFTTGGLIFLKSVPDPERFGVAYMKDGKIYKMVEKPKKPKSDLAITGLYCYDNTVFDKIRKCIPSARGEKEITTVNEMYLEEGKLDHVVFNGFWSDSGTISSLVQCDEYFRKKEDE